MSPVFSVRRAVAADAPGLLILMRELAHFEHYIDRFRVTEESLIARGFGMEQASQFVAYVANSGDGILLGYAVIYLVPFTFDLHPNLILKELYVRDESRGLGIGHALMTSVIAHAKEHGCARLKWDVLPENTMAKKFYGSFGGTPDSAWENWVLPLS